MKTIMGFGRLGSQIRKTGEYKNTATPGFNGGWRICFSVDGLVMLKCACRDGLMLWNPSIRKCRLVLDSQGFGFQELGLGFDPLIKDYKLIRVSRITPSSVEIYTVGTSSWKTVPAQGALPSTWLETASGRWSVFFKGCLYMLSSSKLISFDLSKEVFKSVELPEYDNSAPAYFLDPIALVDMGSSLAVLHFSSHVGSVWVLEDNAWIMRCTFAMSVPRFLYLKKNGDLLFNINMFGMVSYNIHTEEKKLPTLFNKEIFRIHGYKESLVLLK